MSKQLHIIYIPGFGDGYDIGRRISLKCWRLFGVTTQFVPMRWNNAESYSKKLKRVNAAIDAAAGKRIVLIGESAGGSIVLPIYIKRHRDLYKVMTICGKNSNGASVSPLLYAKHVAFRDAMQATDTAATQLMSKQLHRFIAFYPLYEKIIPFEESVIPGSRLIRLASAGHFLTIFLALTFFSGFIVRTARRENF